MKEQNIIQKIEQEIENAPRGLAGYRARDLVKEAAGFYIVEAGKNVSLFYENNLLTCWLDLSGGEVSLPHTTKITKSGTNWAAFEGSKNLGIFADIFEAKEACVLAQA